MHNAILPFAFLLFTTTNLLAVDTNDVIAVANRPRQIREEIAKLGEHEWAGVYKSTSESIAVSPTAGYRKPPSNCCPGSYPFEYEIGTVARTNGRVRFSGETTSYYLPIAWGERRYLIPTDDIVNFCNAVNQGTEANISYLSTFLLRTGDEHIAVLGRPNVPPEFRAYLLDKPIEARISKVTKQLANRPLSLDEIENVAVTLDAGSNQGLLVGMELISTNAETLVTIQITKVEKISASGRATAVSSSPPQTGWRISTRPKWMESQAN